MALINLLPWREELREERKRQFLILWGASAICAVLMVLFIHWIFASKIDLQLAMNDRLQQEIQSYNRQIAAIKTFQKLKTVLIARMEIIQQLQANRIQIVHVFHEIVNILPKGVYLKDVSLTGTQLTLVGQAESNTNVSHLMRNIESSLWLSKPLLTEIKSEKDKGERFSDFSLVSTMTMRIKPGEKPSGHQSQ